MSGVRILRRLRDLIDVTFGTPSDGDVVTYDTGTDSFVLAAPSGGGGGGAPTTADYLVGTSNGSLSAEIVVGTSPGGELGGTWASPTVDATHSGSSHASVQAAAEATAASALSAHSSDTTSVHGIADTSALETTSGAQAKVDAHVNDTSAAHAASAISILDTAADFTATDVEGALAELQADAETDAQALTDHIADSSAAHAASAISIVDSGAYFTGTDVEAALQELGAGGGGGDVATDVIFTAKGDLPVGTGASTAQKLSVGPNDYVLTADSAETTGMKWAAAASSGAPSDAAYYVTTANGSLSAEVVVPAYIQTLLDDTDAATARTTLGVGVDVLLNGKVSGAYYTTPVFHGAWANSGGQATGIMCAFPIWLESGTLDRMAIPHQSTSTASEVFRMGIYADNGSGAPGALLLDAGTVSLSTAAALKTITISLAVTKGLYWIAGCKQGPTSNAVLVGGASSGPCVLMPSGGPTLGTVYDSSPCFTKTGTTGAFPDPFSSTTVLGFNAAATPPFVRYA